MLFSICSAAMWSRQSKHIQAKIQWYKKPKTLSLWTKALLTFTSKFIKYPFHFLFLWSLRNGSLQRRVKLDEYSNTTYSNGKGASCIEMSQKSHERSYGKGRWWGEIKIASPKINLTGETSIWHNKVQTFVKLWKMNSIVWSFPPNFFSGLLINRWAKQPIFLFSAGRKPLKKEAAACDLQTDAAPCYCLKCDKL